VFIVSLDPGGAADAAALSVIESKFADMTDIHLVIVRHIEELRGLTQTQAADGLATVVNDLVRKVPGQVVTTIDARGLGNTTAELAAYAGLAPIAIMPTSGEPAASFKAFATGQGLQISVGNAQILAAFRRHTSTGTFSVAEDVELADTFFEQIDNIVPAPTPGGRGLRLDAIEGHDDIGRSVLNAVWLADTLVSIPSIDRALHTCREQSKRVGRPRKTPAGIAGGSPSVGGWT